MAAFHKPSKAQFFFQIKGMACNRSSAAVMAALVALDHCATVRIDLPMRRVVIESDKAEPSDFKEAIDRAGYASIRQWPAESMYI